MKELSNNKVMVFGDSVSKGVVYDGRELSVLDNGVVKEVTDHYRVEFKNISVYGQTLKRLYDRRIIDKHLKEMSDEDAALTYVVLVIGGNDCDFDWAAVARAPSVKHIPKTSLDAFEKMLVDSIEKIKKKRRDARVVHDAAHQSAEIFFKRHLHGRRRLQGDGVFERRPYEHQPLSRVLQSCNRQMRA